MMNWKHEIMSLYCGLLELGARIEDGGVTVADLMDEHGGGEAAAMAAGLEVKEAKKKVEAEVIRAARAKFERALEALKGRVMVVEAGLNKCAVGRGEGRTVNAPASSQRGSAAA